MEKWFDYRWHNCTPERASFYAIITKTDSGWHRVDYFAHGSSLQMTGTYEDSTCKIANGIFYYFYANKKVNSFGRNWHGKRQGLWLGYHQNGTMSDSTSYQNGNPVGISMRWYTNGYVHDSVNWQNDGTGIGYYWYEDGKP